MDIISQAESTHFLWDFKNRTLVYDFDTKERSTHFSIFPKFKEVFITALTMAPNGVVNINSRITYMYILEGVLYVKIDEITEDDTLDSIMNAINIDDDRIVFYTDEFNPLDNDVENNWNNFGG